MGIEDTLIQLRMTNKQLEKLIDSERQKTISFIKQIDELNGLNSQITMQNSDFKRRLISLDLVGVNLT